MISLSNFVFLVWQQLQIFVQSDHNINYDMMLKKNTNNIDFHNIITLKIQKYKQIWKGNPISV